MDRLSAYAARESESESVEDKKKHEEEALTNLMERLRLSQEAKNAASKSEGPKKEQQHDEADTNGASAPPTSEQTEDSAKSKDEAQEAGTNGEAAGGNHRGIPGNVELYEVFYEQVINLVNVQKLYIQDTIALLGSLANLAL